MLSVVGLSLTEAFTTLGKGAELFPVASLAEHYRDAFHAMRESGEHIEPLYPGAADAIAALARRDDVVARHRDRQVAARRAGSCWHHGLLDHFLTIKTADDAPSKPDPGMVLHAMREAGVDAEDTVVVGDTVYDIAMARAAGASAIGVAWGYHRAEALSDAGAFKVIDRFRDLASRARCALDEMTRCSATIAPVSPHTLRHVNDCGGWSLATGTKLHAEADTFRRELSCCRLVFQQPRLRNRDISHRNSNELTRPTYALRAGRSAPVE